MTGIDSGQAEQEIFKTIVDYLHDRMGVSYNKLSRSTDVVHEIGMTGDDAVEFLEWFDRQFPSRKGPLKFNAHFDSEAGIWPFGLAMPFLRLFFPRYRKPGLTIESLIKLAKETKAA